MKGVQNHALLWLKTQKNLVKYSKLHFFMFKNEIMQQFVFEQKLKGLNLCFPPVCILICIVRLHLVGGQNPNRQKSQQLNSAGVLHYKITIDKIATNKFLYIVNY